MRSAKELEESEKGLAEADSSSSTGLNLASNPSISQVKVEAMDVDTQVSVIIALY